LKIVWIAQDLHIGGGQRVILELSKKLVKRGHEVEIIYPRGRGGFQIPAGVKATPSGIDISSPILSLIANTPAVIAATPLCDWMICSMPISAFTGFAAARLRQAKMLYYVMNDERAMFDDRSLMRSTLLISIYHSVTDLAHQLPVKIAVNSQWTGTRVKHGRGYGYPVIPHGVDLDVFNPDGPRSEDKNIFTIATVGRRHRWKGLSDLIEALNLLSGEQSGDGKFQLNLITQDDIDLSSAKFPTHILKPESDEEIATAFHKADIFVHPSWFEGFGMPPLEAMACGTPPVITDSGGVREFARDGENCLLVPARDPAAIANAVTRLMENGELVKRLSASGIETASEFTWDNAANTLEEVLS